MQTTLAETHSFKLKYITQFLKELVDYKLKKINVVFLIPNQNKFKMPSFADKLPEPFKAMFDADKDCNVNTITRWS